MYPRDELEYRHDSYRIIRVIADGKTDHDDGFIVAKTIVSTRDHRRIGRARHNVITRLVSVRHMDGSRMKERAGGEITRGAARGSLF